MCTDDTSSVMLSSGDVGVILACMVDGVYQVVLRFFTSKIDFFGNAGKILWMKNKCNNLLHMTLSLIRNS